MIPKSSMIQREFQLGVWTLIIQKSMGHQFSITNVSVFRNNARNVIDNHSKTLKASWTYV